MDNKEIEEIVNQSGIKIWQPKTWHEKIKNDSRLAIALYLQVAIVTLTIVLLVVFIFSNNSKADKISKLKKENAQVKKQAKSLQKDLNEKNQLVSDCQYHLEQAWGAWQRRNDLIVKVLGNIFAATQDEIRADNNLAQAEKSLASMECDSMLDY